jgi:Tfp pilus assembly PilM family ATPase
MVNHKKLLRNSGEHSVIGIDIGHNSIRAVELAHQDKNSMLVAYGEHPYGTKIDPVILHDNILKLLDNPTFGNFTSKNISISLPRSIARNHFVVLDTEHDTSTEDSIRRFIVDKLGLNLSDYYFDYQHINTKLIDDRLVKVLMVDIVERKFFEDFTDKLKDNLHINSIAPTFAKQLSSVFDKDSNSVVLVDIGHDTTKMFFCNQTNCIEKRINIGGFNITQKIADEFDLDHQRALELQKNVGLLGSDLANKINTQITSVVGCLAQGIREFIEECIEIFGIEVDSEIDIYITGSIMGTKGFNQSLNELSGYNLSIVDPWKDVGLYPLKPIPKHRLPKYAGAIALAS